MTNPLLTAIAHILYSGICIGIVCLLIYKWDTRSSQVRAKSVPEGVLISKIINDRFVPISKSDAAALQGLDERMSTEKFGNRLADALGWVQQCLWWTGITLCICSFFILAWLGLFRDHEIALGTWFVLLAFMGTWLAAGALGSICNLLTGRYPGEPKAWRAQVEAIKRKSVYPR
jgi:hypothetical protein